MIIKNRDPRIVNAVLRCSTENAAPLFQRIHEVPNLWVLELGPFFEETWPVWLQSTEEKFAENEAFLKNLKHESSDYTLHIKIEFSEIYHFIRMPPSFSAILATCGITVEIYSGVLD